MTYRKTWLSYFLWAVYTCTTGVMLANYTILFWQKEINAAISYGAIVFVFLVFAMVAGCYFFIRKGLQKAGEAHRGNRRKAFYWELMIVLVLFFAGLLYRVLLCMQSMAAQITETQYYQLAVIKDGDGVESIMHGASYLYTFCLSFVLSFLGNKIIAAVWMQILIQMLTVLLGFFTVRKLVGRVPALIVMTVLSVSSVYVDKIFEVTPDCFFLLLYLSGMAVIGCFVSNYCRLRMGAAAVISGALLSGIAVGILIYLDVVSLTLLILLIGLFTGSRVKEKKKDRFSLKIPVWLCVLIIAAGGLTLVGMFVLDAYACHEKIGLMVEEWLTLYQGGWTVDYVFYRTERSIVECLALVAMAALLIMSFWNRRRVQNATPWICLMLILAPTPLTKIGVLPYQTCSILLWGILAGIGLQQSFVLERNPKKREKLKKKPEPVQYIEPLVSENPPRQVEVEPKPRFIENPLPLPKKHEKKEMNYQYEIMEDKWDFDIDVADDDDFDI